MIETPWYHWVVYMYYRVRAWSPVVMRRGVYDDMLMDISDYRYSVHSALDALEHGAEDKINEARSHLYQALQIGQ